MKELSIEEKAKRYDKTIKLAKDSFNYPDYPGFIRADVVFPELKESEDEKIRKRLIEWVEEFRKLNPTNADHNAECSEALTWLKNQGEQKPAYTKEYDFHGIKFIPKFAKGDIIKDKKCGEVSTIEDFSYDTGLYTHTYGQFPITIQDNYEIIEQKPAWSKEDEKIIRRIDSLLYSQCKIHGSEYEEIHNWLKSLRPQSTWKPSDEQIDALHYVTNFDYGGYKATLVSLYE